MYQFATNYSTHDPAFQPPAEIGGVGGTADQRTPPDRPLLGEVNEREVRRRPCGQAAPITDPAAGAAAHRFDEPLEREAAAEDQVCVEGGEGRLVSQETGGGLLERELFLFGGVGRVVRGDEVEDAFAQGRPIPSLSWSGLAAG